MAAYESCDHHTPKNLFDTIDGTLEQGSDGDYGICYHCVEKLPKHSFWERNENGETPLFYAASIPYISFESLACLCADGLDVNEKYENGSTILHVLAHRYLTEENYGYQNVNLIDIQNSIRFILSKGGDLNIADDNGETAMDLLERASRENEIHFHRGENLRAAFYEEIKNYDFGLNPEDKTW